MTKSEFMEGIHILQNNYNQKFSADKLKIYYENLKDMNKDKYIENIKKLVKTNEYMPNVAQIRTLKQRLSNFEGRDYSNFNFNSLLANEGVINK
jgi:hypothetical protein